MGNVSIVVDEAPDRSRGRGELRALLRIRASKDPSGEFIFEQQLRELVRSAPLGIFLNALTAAALALELGDVVAGSRLAFWIAAVLLCNLARLASNERIRWRLNNRQPQPNALVEITALVVLTSVCWVIPVFAWAPTMPDHDRVILALVLMGIMGGGGASLGSMPFPALALIVILSVGQMRISLYHHGWIMVSLAFVMIMALANGAIGNARLLLRHLRARRELEEQAELIGLLREFQSNGSEWLWELDADLHIRYMSAGMAQSIGRPLGSLIGRSFPLLVDPTGRYRAYSEGIRSLLEHLEQGRPIHEVALPTEAGDRWYCLSARPVTDERGKIIGWRGVASDISKLRSGPGAEAVRVARRDPLTGLANRLMVRETIEEAQLRQLGGGSPCALLLLDLDRFKQVNDTLGHAIGDRLLVEASRRLEESCGSDAGIGRLGGDEFAVVWRGRTDTLTLLDLADRITRAIDRPFAIGASSVQVGVSIGIARASRDGDTQDELMRSADLALYRSKANGRGCSTFYEPWMLARAQAERLLESDVRDAVRRGDLDLHFQPIVDAQSHAVIGREALLRWTHPRHGPIGPDIFVPIIEDVGLIHQIGDWVIATACREAAHWRWPTRVAVNISVAQLTGPGLKIAVETALAQSGLSPDRLELEMTESVFLGDDVATLSALASLQALGVRLVLDDFGKGYSSFGYLSRACFSKIKIDQMFVRGAAEGRRESVAIIESILALAHGMGVETTAEGVETAGQARMLTSLGCTQLQGYLFGKPVPASEVANDAPWLRGVAPSLPVKRRA